MEEFVRRVRLFRSGRDQLLRIPIGLQFDAEEAIVRKQGERLIVEPLRTGGLLELLETLEPIEDEFPDLAGEKWRGA